MARPKSISTGQILQAARDLFLEKGLDASTAEIAQRAGVSEGSVFNRFPTKHDLFLAAMGLDERPAWIEKVAQLAGQGRVEDNLRDIVRDGIAFFRGHLPRIMLMWSSRELPCPPELCRQRGPDALPRVFLEALTGYVASEVAQQRIDTATPEVVARALLGAMVNFVFLEMIGVQGSESLDVDTFARALVHTLWAGVAPAGSPARAESI